ncbi:MAG: hypothetical protein ABIL58_24170 [Pseudomonadota bacterium]
MATRVKTQVLRRLALAYHRAQDRILVQRGLQFRGTPARYYEDIRNYITHAAIHHLEGMPPPRALGHPGIAAHAWFASRQSADAVGHRHDGYRTGALFDEMMKDFPLDALLAPRCLVEAGRVGDPATLSLAYTVTAAALTVVSRPSDNHPEISVQDRSSLSVAVEHRIFSIVRLENDIVGAAIFQRDSGSDLYRLALIGMRRRSGHPADARRRRLEHLAFRRFNAAIRHWPGVSFDFIGAAEPEAAAMGYSLFRYLRKKEMARLKALATQDYAAERRRVTSYRYPVFPRAAVVSPGQTLKTMLMETPRWVLHTCRLAHRRSWRPERRMA